MALKSPIVGKLAKISIAHRYAVKLFVFVLDCLFFNVSCFSMY